MLHQGAVVAAAALVVCVLVVGTCRGVDACKGCVSLDEYSFRKLLPRFKAVLVKFDAAYPYGEKHETFTALSGELASNDDILVAEIAIKDYGEKDNEMLARTYGIDGRNDLPQVQLFRDGAVEPVARFDKNAEWTVETLRDFVRDNARIYIGFPGCLEAFDRLTAEFVRAGDRAQKLEEVTRLAQEANDSEKPIANIYVLFMRKILESGDEFVQQEAARLSNILNKGKVNEIKRKELTTRLNILHSFSGNVKDEL